MERVNVEDAAHAAQRLTAAVSHGLDVLYGLWRGDFDSGDKRSLLLALENLQASLFELGKSQGSTLHHNYSPEQLDTCDLERLVSALRRWGEGPLSPATCELAGDCVERLSGQRLSEIEKQPRGSQETIPLGSAVTKGIACLAALRDSSWRLFTPREARIALDELRAVLPEMPELDRKTFGLTINDVLLAALTDLGMRLRQVPQAPDLDAEVRALAGRCLVLLLGNRSPF